MDKLTFPVTRREAERSGGEYSSEKNKNALFPSQLRELRKEKGVSQDTLSKILKVSKSTLGLWETGDTLPDAKSMCDLADYFGVSADYLLGRTQTKTMKANVKAVCDFLGLSEEAVMVIRHEKRDSAFPVMDYMIREFWLSFLATNLKRSISDIAISEVHFQDTEKILLLDKSFNKWNFIEICGKMFEDFIKNYPKPEKEKIQCEYTNRLIEREEAVSKQLGRIRELIKKNPPPADTEDGLKGQQT